jgi:hypothetical protein
VSEDETRSGSDLPLRPALEQYIRSIKDERLAKRLRELATEFPDATLLELYVMAGRG